MALKTEKKLKLYYSITEVAKMFGVNESLLRYWEKEFPFLSPKKAGGNIRQYTQADIENVRLVYHLVKEKGMTLAGAKYSRDSGPAETGKGRITQHETGIGLSHLNKCRKFKVFHFTI